MKCDRWPRVRRPTCARQYVSKHIHANVEELTDKCDVESGSLTRTTYRVDERASFWDNGPYLLGMSDQHVLRE